MGMGNACRTLRPGAWARAREQTWTRARAMETEKSMDPFDPSGWDWSGCFVPEYRADRTFALVSNESAHVPNVCPGMQLHHGIHFLMRPIIHVYVCARQCVCVCAHAYQIVNQRHSMLVKKSVSCIQSPTDCKRGRRKETSHG